MGALGFLNTATRLLGRGLSAAGDLLQGVGGADPTPKAGMDDNTITRKVESVVSRIEGYDKGRIDVNTADGVVYLHGEAQRPDLVKEIEAAVRAVPEVRDVENLLHLPNTPAPTRADAPGRASRKAGTRKSAGDRPVAPRRFERPVEGAETSE